MARLPRELNPDILKDRLPDNYRDVLNQAERNVNRAVGQLIGDYRSRLESLVKQLEDGTFSKEFQEKISNLKETLETGLSQIKDNAEVIKNKADAWKQSAQGGQALTALALDLSVEAAKLQTLLDQARTEVKNVGDLSGKVLGAALRELI